MGSSTGISMVRMEVAVYTTTMYYICHRAEHDQNMSNVTGSTSSVYIITPVENIIT